MTNQALAPLSRAVEARRAGRMPDPEDLAACRKARWKAPDLRCWNGRRSDRPECGFFGSQNIPFYAETGLANWEWIAGICRLDREEGLFGHELGSPGAFYYGGIIGCKRLALRELLRAGRQEAEAVRRSIHASLAWDALTAVPTPRRQDVLNAGGDLVRTENPAKPGKLARATVAVAGNRWTVKARGKLTSEDSHSVVLQAALEPKTSAGFGLTETDRSLLERTVDGDPAAAEVVAGWMFGTIDTPDKRWRWRLRRTRDGAESVFFGPWPNPHKPCRTATQVTNGGTWTSMQPARKGVNRGWAGIYEVEISGGMIRATCAKGSAELPELGGEILWHVDVVGKDVRFTAGGALSS